jgi:hypothetical protein
LTLLGGKPVHGDGDFKDLAPALPPAMPDWSPVRTHGGYQQRDRDMSQSKYASACGCTKLCNVHGHAHAGAWANELPVSDAGAFWGALGCSCWAF